MVYGPSQEQCVPEPPPSQHQHQRSQYPRRLPVGQSTLTGRVIYQDNEQPLKGVRVRIFKPTGVERPLVAFANNNGEFRVEKLAAGKYYISIGEGIASPSGIGMRLPMPITAIPRREDFEEIVPRHDANRCERVSGIAEPFLVNSRTSWSPDRSQRTISAIVAPVLSEDCETDDGAHYLDLVIFGVGD